MQSNKIIKYEVLCNSNAEFSLVATIYPFQHLCSCLKWENWNINTNLLIEFKVHKLQKWQMRQEVINLTLFFIWADRKQRVTVIAASWVWELHLKGVSQILNVVIMRNPVILFLNLRASKAKEDKKAFTFHFISLPSLPKPFAPFFFSINNCKHNQNNCIWQINGSSRSVTTKTKQAKCLVTCKQRQRN